MALGNPALDPAAQSPWQRGEPFAVMASGPLAHGYGRTSTMSLGRGVTFPSSIGPRLTGKSFGSIGPSAGGGLLPSAGALDYAHKLTSTTLLLGALVAFLILHRGRYGKAARSIASRHIGEV